MARLPQIVRHVSGLVLFRDELSGAQAAAHYDTRLYTGNRFAIRWTDIDHHELLSVMGTDPAKWDALSQSFEVAWPTLLTGTD